MERSTAFDTASEKPNPSHHSTGTVQMRIKNANSHHDRLSQSKSMILSENVKVPEPVSRHRRNHSQHNLTLANIISTQDHTVVEKEGYLLKAKIADGGKKLRKNWSTSWVVLTAQKMEFYKESKQPALANLKPGYKPECVDLCGACIEWTSEKSSRKNVFQDFHIVILACCTFRLSAFDSPQGDVRRGFIPDLEGFILLGSFSKKLGESLGRIFKFD
ncbi:rho GTPase-activating protein 15-like isoform X3 [Neopsephotus bourkii]|uniref:rho GTPase-activating protein 15-like isoform X3 n=1 Tax=Neopsephotus bourkii TaxID=309878 RepID=UPI002AA50BE4|nr:rho GTPase-activating protein 15-like isoform X3 [Neopsephotus bourkii]